VATWCLIGVDGAEMASHQERDPKSSLSISALKASAVYSAHLISGLSIQVEGLFGALRLMLVDGQSREVSSENLYIGYLH
jgi:hypothetical protein